ncbi:hypothetical protein BFN03_05725 [Rhodococcus sp. WMMA185]|uniref:hypothetical protein n=1 Tax=Rhodococcus sp. WMMA185 TaxID=679318 RepID=UPI0008785532|nr:hypothetical protein [Rhodococcus sp. WMMA185]AOW92380.1 hypothetical protein BFN03_05725 [Rhodococcus sp. WMMA185]
MTAAPAVGTAMAFLWLGMVLAISFVEAPLKFRAPDVTVRIGLGIGRLVFRALNAIESVLAIVLIIVVVVADVPARVVIAALVAVGALAAQLVAVRPILTRRSDRILAGEDAPRSRAHFAYIALEVVKVLALLATGVALLAA